MKKNIIVIGVIIFTSTILSSCKDSCKGHETDIKNGQIEKAEKMGMIVNNITVEYIGDCQYRCVSHVYDPGTVISTPNNINSIIIYKWDGNNYSFLRDE